ncbi:UNVERIFIED_CONTAM: hypothetical protein K2H54_010725, partial [Gekko kuhli]
MDFWKQDMDGLQRHYLHTVQLHFIAIFLKILKNTLIFSLHSIFCYFLFSLLRHSKQQQKIYIIPIVIYPLLWEFCLVWEFCLFSYSKGNILKRTPSLYCATELTKEKK